MSAPSWSRRHFLRHALFGSSLVGMRALASGLPAAWLLRPHLALADLRQQIADGAAPDAVSGAKPQYLILSTSSLGDPIGCNAPGTYNVPNLQVMHPVLPSSDARYGAWATRQVSFGSFTGPAAGPWGTLDAATCARTAFIHHATGTVVHSDESRVLTLQDSVVGPGNSIDQLSSAMARQLSPLMGTVQTEPVCLGASGASEAVVFGGRPQPMLLPQALADVLIPPGQPPAAPLSQLQQLRDRDLDALVKFMRTNATPSECSFLDAYVTSGAQVRSIKQNLLNQLGSLQDNSAKSQVVAALILAQMNVSPVFTIHIPFGADNHFDGALSAEVAQTITGVQTIASMMTQVQNLGLSDKITFASLNVFGRTMSLTNTNDNVSSDGTFKGRSHNSSHHAAIISGPNVAGGVYGGLMAAGGDIGAAPFNSAKGASTHDNDITMPTTSNAVGNSLASVGRTIAAAAGLSETQINQFLNRGVTISAALANC